MHSFSEKTTGQMFPDGIFLRWFNTAGFEIILPGGKHLLTDPYLDSSKVFPFSVDQIEQCDYLLLSHIHIDHAADLKSLEEKFNRFVLCVGDLSADPLCKWQDLDLRNFYRVRGGSKYIFDDVTIEAFDTRHTESMCKHTRSSHYSEKNLHDWWGLMEVLSYLITTRDGTRILIWAGMTTEDQKNMFRDLRPDIAIMHLSPKSDPKIFADMIQSWKPKLVIPHHYDAIRENVKEHPEQISRHLSKKFQSLFIHCDANGTPIFDEEAFVLHFAEAIHRKSPTTSMLRLSHHKWYRFSTAYTCLE